MTDKDLYSTILGVCLPWQVADVTLDEAGNGGGRRDDERAKIQQVRHADADGNGDLCYTFAPHRATAMSFAHEEIQHGTTYTAPGQRTHY